MVGGALSGAVVVILGAPEHILGQASGKTTVFGTLLFEKRGVIVRFHEKYIIPFQIFESILFVFVHIVRVLARNEIASQRVLLAQAILVVASDTDAYGSGV